LVLERVLILTASFGEGHRQAAFALKELILQDNPNALVEIVDYIDQLNRPFNRVAQFMYIQTTKKAPKVYGYFYKHVNFIPENSVLSKSFNFIRRIFGRKKLLAFIQKFEPQVVIHTFPTSAGVLSEVKEKGLITIPSVTVITDYAAHRAWIHPYTDLYLVASTEVRAQLLKENVPLHKIKVTGIPIKQVFLQEYNREELKRKYNLDPLKKTILISAGAFGISEKIVDIANFFFNLEEEVEFIIVAGRNKQLYAEIAELKERVRNKVILFGFTDKMAELMAVADLVITKSGGLTTTEAIAMRLPMLFFKPIPGQEESNANYLKKYGVAMIANNSEEIKIQFLRLVLPSERLKVMRDNFRELWADIRIDSTINELHKIIMRNETIVKK